MICFLMAGFTSRCMSCKRIKGDESKQNRWKRSDGPYLSGHDQSAGLVFDFHDHSAVAGAQFAVFHLLEVGVAQFAADLLFLAQEQFHAFALFVVHADAIQLFLQAGHAQFVASVTNAKSVVVHSAVAQPQGQTAPRAPGGGAIEFASEKPSHGCSFIGRGRGFKTTAGCPPPQKTVVSVAVALGRVLTLRPTRPRAARTATRAAGCRPRRAAESGSVCSSTSLARRSRVVRVRRADEKKCCGGVAKTDWRRTLEQSEEVRLYRSPDSWPAFVDKDRGGGRENPRSTKRRVITYHSDAQCARTIFTSVLTFRASAVRDRRFACRHYSCSSDGGHDDTSRTASIWETWAGHFP